MSLVNLPHPPSVIVSVTFFWNRDEGRLRAGWRIALLALLATLLGVALIVLIAEPLTALHRRGLFLPQYERAAYDRVINIIVGPLLAICIVGSVAFAARVLDRRSIRDFGIQFDRAWWSCLALGLALGACVMSLVFAVEYWAGWIDITGTLVVNVTGVSLMLALSFSFVKVLCVGIYEELVARGYLLRNLAEGTNLPIAVIASSAIFAILHITNDNATIVSTLGLFVNGLLFAVALLITGRLSTSIGLHISWNLFEGVVFGFPVSGDKEGASVFAIAQRGPEIITGGAFGPEAGLLGIAASLLGIGALLLWRATVRRPKGRSTPALFRPSGADMR